MAREAIGVFPVIVREETIAFFTRFDSLYERMVFPMAVKNSPQKPPAAAPENGKQRPAHEIRLGRIKATIWANQGDNGTWYNVTLSRNYKDGDEWKSSASFGRDELLTVAKAADMANTWIHEQNPGSSTNGNGTQEAEEEVPY